MTLFKKSLYIGAMLSLLLSSGAQAGIINELLGVDIGGTNYDVTFYDNSVTFRDIWDTDGDFVFEEPGDTSILNRAPTFWNDFSATEAAIQAVISALGLVDTIIDVAGDGVMVPWEQSQAQVNILIDIERLPDIDNLTQSVILTDDDGILPGFHLASFEESASIPEPTTLALMTLGLAGIGYTRRKTAH